MNVTHPASIPVGQPTNFTVEVDDAGAPHEPIYLACVTLYKPDDVYEYSYTGTDGKAYFTITPNSPGDLKVSVTRYFWLLEYPVCCRQYLPSQTHCAVGGRLAGKAVKEDTDPTIPKTLSLSITSSNPVVNKLKIDYAIPRSESIRLLIYNSLGRRVCTLNEGELNPGYYHLTFNLRSIGLTSGVYWLVLEQGEKRLTRKIVVLR